MRDAWDPAPLRIKTTTEWKTDGCSSDWKPCRFKGCSAQKHRQRRISSCVDLHISLNKKACKDIGNWWKVTMSFTQCILWLRVSYVFNQQMRNGCVFAWGRDWSVLHGCSGAEPLTWFPGAPATGFLLFWLCTWWVLRERKALVKNWFPSLLVLLMV